MAITRMTIIGLGNIGGSMALAVRNNPAADVDVTAYVRRADAGREALRLGAADRISDDLADAVRGADLVVLATPVSAMQTVMRLINPHLATGAVVTDVGSTKVDVNAWGRELIGPQAIFVGGHPMAGSAGSGLAGANGDVFRETVYCVAAEPGTPEPAIDAVRQLVRWIGAAPLLLSAQQHDDCVAQVSHLPMLVASALVTAAATHPDWDTMSRLAALGFREMTRSAAGSSEVRRSVCSTNKAAIAASIDRFIDTLQQYRQHILRDDEQLLGLFQDARAARRDWVARRYPR
ncbi:MAG: prephenate dehydrogenase/arogenate dehydrogenase family protein [Halioglobus sp.]|nr:prephenate dehydrogenase/arogenate dehydrogenase family protein [Halioglobus sp.]